MVTPGRTTDEADSIIFKFLKLTDEMLGVLYNTTLLSLCREICFLARHLHKNIQNS